MMHYRSSGLAVNRGSGSWNTFQGRTFGEVSIPTEEAQRPAAKRLVLSASERRQCQHVNADLPPAIGRCAYEVVPGTERCLRHTQK